FGAHGKHTHDHPGPRRPCRVEKEARRPCRVEREREGVQRQRGREREKRAGARAAERTESSERTVSGAGPAALPELPRPSPRRGPAALRELPRPSPRREPAGRAAAAAAAAARHPLLGRAPPAPRPLALAATAAPPRARQAGQGHDRPPPEVAPRRRGPAAWPGPPLP
ncbi:unnamed protein product, partial [Prorocentrum cordatum]